MLSRLFRANKLEAELFSDVRTKCQVAQADEARHRSLPGAPFAAVYSCDDSGVLQFYNHPAAELWGRRPVLGDTDERFCGSFMLYRADGSFMPHEQCPMAEVLSGKVSGVDGAKFYIQRPDGSRVAVIVNIAPVIDDRGKIVGAINTFFDIVDH